MRFGLWIVVALVAGAIGAHFFLADPGYVVVNFRDYIVETSVPVLLALLAAALGAVWLMRKLLAAPRRLGEAAGRYRGRRAGRQFTRGLIEMAEGNFGKGEKLLTRKVGRADAPLLNYLAAARAAQLQGKVERRDEWLRRAYEETPEAANAVLLTQAELQIANGQHEQALATLGQLEERVPGHAQALLLMGRLYSRLGDWKRLGELLPRLRAQRRVPDETLEEWSVAVYSHRITEAGDDSAAVVEAWRGVPKPLKQHSVMRVAYVEALMRAGENEAAESEIKRMLGRRWDDGLVRLYGLVKTDHTNRQLKQVETWLAERDEDAELLLAAARLCVRSELWGKARSYLESSIAMRATPEAYREYGALLARLGEGDSAAEAYRSGLALVADAGPRALPHLEARTGG